MIIYRIFNKINGKSYIGQSVNSFDKRYKGNKWWKYTHNEILKNSIMKKDGYYKDLSETRDKILPLINLSISEISNNLNITKRRVNWCIKKYKLK